jgi:imidazoleglycerol-phosphate dehydratase/histidinol-phosphatase
MAQRRVLLIEREGALLKLVPGTCLKRCEDLELLPDALDALRRARQAGFELHLLARSDRVAAAPQRLLRQLLESQGAAPFEQHELPDDASSTGACQALALALLRGAGVDPSSAVVGGAGSDLELARQLGVRSFRIGPGGPTWSEIAHQLTAAPRTATVERVTRETRIRVAVDLDREAQAEVATGIGFFDHMLEQIGRHGGFALSLTCAGDTHIDEHHTVEDCALALGDALKRALGDKRGIGRYGFSLPMDETRAEALLDLSGRAYFVFEGRFERERVGELATELVPHFFRSLADALAANLHLRVQGENTHHMVEACFKATARALRMAIRREGTELPTTKGVL